MRGGCIQSEVQNLTPPPPQIINPTIHSFSFAPPCWSSLRLHHRCLSYTRYSKYTQLHQIPVTKHMHGTSSDEKKKAKPFVKLLHLARIRYGIMKQGAREGRDEFSFTTLMFGYKHFFWENVFRQYFIFNSYTSFP